MRGIYMVSVLVPSPERNWDKRAKAYLMTVDVVYHSSRLYTRSCMTPVYYTGRSCMAFRCTNTSLLLVHSVSDRHTFNVAINWHQYTERIQAY